MKQSVIFYAVVIQTESDGMFLDFPFLGGVVPNDQVERLARDITDDRAIPGTVITKIFNMNGTESLLEMQRIASRQFNQTANLMYDMEEIQQRKDKKRRKN